MKQLKLNFRHSIDFADVDEAFAAYVTEAHKLDTVLANLGCSIYVDSDNYVIGIEDPNGIVKPFLILMYNSSAPPYSYYLEGYTCSFNGKTKALTQPSNYWRKLASTDVWYSPFTGNRSSSSNSSGGGSFNSNPFIFQSANYYQGNGNTFMICGEVSGSSTSSPKNQNYYRIGYSGTIFLTMTVYYNDDSAFFCVGNHSYNTSDNDIFQWSFTFVKKIGNSVRVFPNYQASTDSSYNYVYGWYKTSLKSYDLMNTAAGTYTMAVTYGNRDYATDIEKGIISEVAIDAENTLGDEVYVGKIPAPNGRYYIGGNPYFFVNGLGVKDPD